MAFDFRKFLSRVTETKTFALAQELAFKKIGEAIDEHAHDPKAIKEIGKVLIEDASTIGKAVAQDTEAQHLVPPENIHPG